MEQKVKFIIIGLIGIAAICFFLLIQTLGAKKSVMRERDSLKSETVSLNSKAEKLGLEIRSRESKIDSLNKELERVNKDMLDLQAKHDAAEKENQELADKLKASQGRMETTSRAVEVVPQTSDEYWGGILKAKTDLEMQLGSARTELKSTLVNNEQLQREKSSLELDINTLKRDREDLARQLEYNKKLMDNISQELVMERNDKIKIENSLKEIRSENLLLTRQLKSLNNRKVNLEKKLQEVQEGKATVDRRLTEMETMLTQKISQISNLKDQMEAIRGGTAIEAEEEKSESVELPPIVVRPQPEMAPLMPESAALPAAAPIAKVLAINRDNNFVIIDIGEDAGLNPAETLRAYRDGKKVADLEVIKVSKNVAACDIKNEMLPLKIGDEVK